MKHRRAKVKRTLFGARRRVAILGRAALVQTRRADCNHGVDGIEFVDKLWRVAVDSGARRLALCFQTLFRCTAQSVTVLFSRRGRDLLQVHRRARVTSNREKTPLQM